MKNKFSPHCRLKTIFFLLSVCLAQPMTVQAQAEPARAGEPLANLSPAQLGIFNEGKADFSSTQSVLGTEPGTEDLGLGPRYNLNSCVGCHSHPATGGTSPPINPQVEAATHYGAKNKIPSFITLNGPVRIARFKFLANGTRDGSVQDLFVITGRKDAKNCHINQPDFKKAVDTNNVIFRIPTPLFGLGLIEAIPDKVILNNRSSEGDKKNTLGIKGKPNRTDTLLGMGGHENRSGNDGTVTRFGWKAQNKSLEIFSGEAYNVEQGVTNELFPDERNVEDPDCLFNTTPEVHTNLEATTPLEAISEITKFSMFMRFLAPPTPKPPTPESKRGSNIFASVGCALCHTPSMKTGASPYEALSNKPVNLYSDLLLHSMGPGLADHVVQQFAGPDDFRTAPLWGLGQRLFFLHDGRTSDLTTAILAHQSTNPLCLPGQEKTNDGVSCQSEANKVIQKFKELSATDKKDLLIFLNSL